MPFIGTCFRFYTEMRVEKTNKAFAYRIYSHFTQQCVTSVHTTCLRYIIPYDTCYIRNMYFDTFMWLCIHIKCAYVLSLKHLGNLLDDKGMEKQHWISFLTLAFRRKTMTVIVAEDCKNAVSSENYLSVSISVTSVWKFDGAEVML